MAVTRSRGERIEGLVEEIRFLASSPALRETEERVRFMLETYGAGSCRIGGVLAETPLAEARAGRAA